MQICCWQENTSVMDSLKSKEIFVKIRRLINTDYFPYITHVATPFDKAAF